MNPFVSEGQPGDRFISPDIGPHTLMRNLFPLLFILK